jgi:hypothetical protein
MPDKNTLRRARADKRAGKSASTQAGEFIREEIHHIRAGKHGARSAKQVIAIGLSKARQAGVDLPAPPRGKVSAATRRSAQRAHARGRARSTRKKSSTRSRATLQVLEHEPRRAASHAALARQARTQAHKRSAAERSRIARKASRTRARRGARGRR